MTAKYKKYPEYKDSGVEWLGMIPTHWTTNKLRYLFSLGKGLTITKENLTDKGIPCVNYGEVHSKYGFEINPELHYLKCVKKEYLKTSSNALLTRGDIIFADTSEDIEGSGNFTQLISDEEVFAGYHTIIARPNDKRCSRFYAYLLDSIELRTQVRNSVKGVKVFSITQAILRGLNLQLPSNKERQRIASFLDHETSKIDTLIEKQQKLIELLKEKRQAVISHAVTKGLNPDAPMKDSGVEWLGEVPEHWEVKPLRHLGTLQNGISQGADYFGEGFQFINYGDVYKDYELPQIASGLAKSTIAEQKTYSVKAGDVFFTRTSETVEEIGYSSTCMDTINYAIFSGFIIRFRPMSKKLNKYFSKFYFRAKFHRIFFVKEMNLVTRASLSQDLLKKLPVLQPPYIEQEEIGKYLQKKYLLFDEIMLKSISAINLLKECRTSLISEAVTGKIDVRNWKIPK